MIADVYQQHALRTAREDHTVRRARLHGASGLSGEAGEACDLLKKHLYLDQPFDRAKYLKELGDVCWYGAVLAAYYRLDLSTVIGNDTERTQYDAVNSWTRPAAFGDSPPGLAVDEACAIEACADLSSAAGDLFSGIELHLFDPEAGSIEVLCHLPMVFQSIARLASLADSTLAEVFTLNVEKLQARYPEKWTAADCSARVDEAQP